jgi:hypothetical protein
MFEKEKAEAARNNGMIKCPLTKNLVPFCDCGPHLTCQHHADVCEHQVKAPPRPSRARSRSQP